MAGVIVLGGTDAFDAMIGNDVQTPTTRDGKPVRSGQAVGCDGSPEWQQVEIFKGEQGPVRPTTGPETMLAPVSVVRSFLQKGTPGEDNNRVSSIGDLYVPQGPQRAWLSNLCQSTPICAFTLS